MADEMPVLLQRAGQDGEMHLPVLVDGHHPDDRPRIPITGYQQHPRTNPGSISSIGQS